MKKKSIDPVVFRQSLLQLLEADAAAEERLLAKFESQKYEGSPLYSSLLYILTHLSFSEVEAKRQWRRIVAHRDLLSMELGRDVGLRVAILDYFQNVSHELKSPKVIEISIYEQTERSAVTDGLTGLFNHAYFLQALKREVHRSKRYQLQLSMIMFDIDDFKKLNDTRGHLEGDRALVKTAALMQESLRDVDILARYGGEEFALILPDTPKTGALIVAERVRGRIEQHFRRGRGRGRPALTISGGIATYPEDAGDAEELVRRADEGLYRSKAEGKNRITLSQGERRRHRRVPASHPVTLNDDVGRRTARARNVSEGGALVFLKEPVPVGSPVSLVIRPPGGLPPVGLRGEVVRVDEEAGRGYNVGLRFLDASESSLVVIRQLGGRASGP